MLVLIRNLRVAVVLVRDAVTIVILVLGVRLTVVIGIQLEVRLSVILAAIRVGHRNRNIELFRGVLVQLRLIREGNGDLTGVLVDLDLVALRSSEVLRDLELRTLRSVDLLLSRLTILVLAGLREGRRRLRLLTRNNQLALVLRLEDAVVLLGHRDSDVDVVLGAIRVGHNNRNSDLVTRGRILRNRNSDLTSVLINRHTLRSIITRSELRALRSLGVLTVLISEGRSIDLDIATRLTRTIGVLRIEVLVLIRNLRVAVVLVRDAVTIVILVLGVRLTVVIGIQLEVRLSVILAAIRVGHRNRNIELFRGVLVQLRLIREGNGDLTGVLVDLDLVALRSSEVLRDLELRTLRSLGVLTVLISEGRGRLGFLTRNNQLVLVRRGELVGILGHQDSPCGNTVATGDEHHVEVVALLSILRDVEGARGDLGLYALGLVELTGLENVALLVTPLNLRRQRRQVAVELRGHLGARGSRLVGRVVISRDRHRSVRHDAVVNVVQRVQVLEPDTIAPVDRQLVLTRDCRGTEVTAAVETSEDRGVEACVAVLDHAVLVLNPHKDVVRVEDVFAFLTLFVLAEAQGVVALVIGLTVDGLENVLGVILEHLLGGASQLARVVLVLLVQLLVRCGAVLGQRRRVDSVAVSSLINTVHRGASSHNALVRATGLEPYTTRNGVRDLGLGRSRADRAFRVLNELVALSGHPAGFVVRRNFLEERRHLLDVAVSYSEGTKRALNQAVERTRDEAVGLAEHDNLVAAIIGERLHPDTVLLVSTRGPGVLTAQLVLPGDALTPSTECERALAAVTSNDARQGVSLRAEDWRVGAVLVTELCVDGNTVQLHVAVVVRSTRVTTRGSHVHVTGNQAFTNAVRVGQVSSIGDTTAGDHVSVDDLILGCGRLSSRLLRLRKRSRSGLGLHHHGAGGCQRQHSTSGCDGLHAVVLKAEGLSPETSTDDTSAQVCHELGPF